MRVVTGEAKGRKLKAPKTKGTRPIIDRVKTALFDILSVRVEDARFLDLFAGTGSVGIEALSRGAASATFIEMNYKVLQIVRENLQITGLADRAEVLHTDAFKFLQSYGNRRYDIIYVAPPQYQEMAAKALALLDTSPLVSASGLVIVQIHPKERAGVAAVPLTRLALTDERRYGSTLLMFYEVQGRNSHMSIQLEKPDYIIVYVSDMQRSTAFYRDVLGLPLKFTSPGWTEFNTGTTTVALHTTGDHKLPPHHGRPPAGQAHIGFIVDDIQAVYESLKAQDVMFSLPPQKQTSGVTLAVLHDPDGLGITLQQQ